MAVAAMTASADVLQDEPSSASPPASHGDDPSADRPRRAGPLPSDLGLPDVVDLPADRAPAGPVPEDDDDEDDDVSSAPSVDELYERVRGRLRHELIVDRERAALLAD
jgi:hypothetical protein